MLKSIIENLFKPRTKALLIQPHDKKRTHHRHALSEYNYSQLQPKTKDLHKKPSKCLMIAMQNQKPSRDKVRIKYANYS